MRQSWLHLVFLCPGWIVAAALVLPVNVAWGQRGGGPPWQKYEIAVTRQLNIGGASLQVDIAAGHTDLPADALLRHVQNAATAVAVYYGRFPVSRARVLIIPVEGPKRRLWRNNMGRHGPVAGLHAHSRRRAHHPCRPRRRLDDDPRTRAHGLPFPARRPALDGRGTGHLR